MLRHLLQRRATKVASALGLLSASAAVSTVAAVSDPIAVIDHTNYAVVMPALIIVAFIGEMIVLVLRQGDDYHS